MAETITGATATEARGADPELAAGVEAPVGDGDRRSVEPSLVDDFERAPDQIRDGARAQPFLGPTSDVPTVDAVIGTHRTVPTQTAARCTGGGHLAQADRRVRRGGGTGS